MGDLLTPELQEQAPVEPEYKPRRMVLNMGPQHPSTHGVLRLVVELDGENVMKATPHIGYLHTGLEKTMENMTYYKALTITDREDYLSNLMNNLAYSMAVEKLIDCEIPPRAQRLRLILNELERIASHLLWLGTHALDIGAMTLFFYTWRERDQILDMKEMMSGVRMMTSWICPGGLRGDMPEGWFHKVNRFVADFPRRLDEYNRLISKNPIFIERLSGVGVISAEDAVASAALLYAAPAWRGICEKPIPTPVTKSSSSMSRPAQRATFTTDFSAAWKS